MSGCAVLLLNACTNRPPFASELGEQRRVVERYVAAFNACDVNAAAALMHPDIEWLSLSDSDIHSVAKGKANLVSESRAYMADGCSTRSELSAWSENGAFVSVLETVHWSNADGVPQTQSAISVYQVENSTIRRVWYFPEVKKDTAQ